LFPAANRINYQFQTARKAAPSANIPEIDRLAPPSPLFGPETVALAVALEVLLEDDDAL